MHVSRESDGPIVPEKRANKAGPKAAAESVEGRGSTKGNATRTLLAAGHSAGKAWHRIVGRTSSTWLIVTTQGKSRMR